MWRNMVVRWWDKNKIYYTDVYREIWVGLALTSYVYYKISYGGKKKAVADKSSSGHH